MLKASDSKELWHSVEYRFGDYHVHMGRQSAEGYVHDPRRIAFTAARYKFASKMLDGMKEVVEVGCGDGFYTPIVAQNVGNLICTDFDRGTIESNQMHCRYFNNLAFEYFDFREGTFPRKVDAIYLLDVLEHVFASEEARFMANMAESLPDNGVLLIGTPNITSQQYASEHSRAGHVNCKSHDGLRELVGQYFRNVFMFGMSDETLHTGFGPMAQYLWALGVGPH